MTDIIPISPEEADLRDAVRQVAGKYGHKYFVDCATSHKEPTELYEELGAAGFLGVHLPEEYGGGGAGLAELCAVIEEVSAAGLPAADDGHRPGHLRVDHRRARVAGA